MTREELAQLHDERFAKTSDENKRNRIDAILGKISAEHVNPADEPAALAALEQTVMPDYCQAVYRYYRKHGRPNE